MSAKAGARRSSTSIGTSSVGASGDFRSNELDRAHGGGGQAGDPVARRRAPRCAATDPGQPPLGGEGATTTALRRGGAAGSPARAQAPDRGGRGVSERRPRGTGGRGRAGTLRAPGVHARTAVRRGAR